MARQECLNLRAVFFVEHGARDVDDAPAGLEQPYGAIENLLLFFLALFESPRPHPPFGVRIAPPRAGACARRIDEHQIHPSGQIVELAADRFWRADLYIARACP